MELNKEHFRAYIFIETQRGRKPCEIYQQLQESHLDIPSQTTVYEWCKRLKDVRLSLEDEVRCGRPITSSTPENVKLLKDLDEQPRTSLRLLSEATGLSKDTIRHILTRDLGLWKFVPPGFLTT